MSAYRVAYRLGGKKAVIELMVADQVVAIDCPECDGTGDARDDSPPGTIVAAVALACTLCDGHGEVRLWPPVEPGAPLTLRGAR